MCQSYPCFFLFNTQVYFWTFFFTLYFLLSLSITCSSSTLPQTISQWGLWSLPSLLTAAEGITITFHSFACFHFWNISTTYSHWSYVTGLENLTNFTPSDRILLRQPERQAGGGGAEERPRQEKKTRWGKKTVILNFGFKKTNSITNLPNIDWTSNLRIGKIQTWARQEFLYQSCFNPKKIFSLLTNDKDWASVWYIALWIWNIGMHACTLVTRKHWQEIF